jgi:ABC-2 type transport system permease protein
MFRSGPFIMLIHALIKEFRLLRRDLHGMAVLFLMPMAFMLIMSMALSNADNVNNDVKIALLAERDNPINKQFIEALAEQQDITVELQPLAELDAAKRALANGEYDMIMVNDNQTDSALQDDRALELLVLASTDRARIAGLKGVIQKVYIQQRLNRYFAEFSSPPEAPENSAAVQSDRHSAPMSENHIKLPDFEAIDDYLSDELIREVYLNIRGASVNKPSSVQQSVPAWLIFGMFFIMIPLSNVMATEKQTNTLTRLRLAKASAFSLLLAKLIPYFLINQLQFWGMILLGIYALPLLGMTGFELQGNMLDYALLSCAISLSALGYALLVSVLAKSTEHAVVLGGGGNIIMAAIGGIMVPGYVMPEIMQSIARVSPMSWALNGFHDLLLNQYSFTQILPQWLSLIGFAAVFLILAYIIYYRQLKQQVRM